jgi:hypothetical protein
MREKLPIGEYEWEPVEDWSDTQTAEEKILSMSDDSDYGYIFEVDLHYPSYLHPLHNDYPLAPENIQVKKEMLSEYNMITIQKHNLKETFTKKLIPNLQDKSNYVVHYRNLKLYLKLGLKITKVHRVLSFKQEAYLRSYIDFNTKQRAESTSESEKAFYKLMNNAVFGKQMENVRKHRSFKIIKTNEEKFEKKILKVHNNPFFINSHFVNDEVILYEMKKKKVLLDKSILGGFTILELSKTFMYDFHYNHIKSTYGDEATLLMTDTDSLCYHIQTDDVYRDMGERKELFDFSDYPKDHFLFDDSNKKVVLKMKDETNSVPIKEFVGVRSKMYSILGGDSSEKKRAKGINKAVVKSMRHEEYKNCILTNQTFNKSMYAFRSKLHNIYTIKMNKLALCPYDDKRYILNDGVKTLAYGHFQILE